MKMNDAGLGHGRILSDTATCAGVRVLVFSSTSAASLAVLNKTALDAC